MSRVDELLLRLLLPPMNLFGAVSKYPIELAYCDQSVRCGTFRKLQREAIGGYYLGGVMMTS